jgi:hypothetical protein
MQNLGTSVLVTEVLSGLRYPEYRATSTTVRKGLFVNKKKKLTCLIFKAVEDEYHKA